MASEVTMPQMGYDMTEGRIAQWLKKPGDSVQKGEAIAEVEHDKVTIEINSFVGVTLLQILAAKETGVDLAVLHGSGPDGRIVLADVTQATAHPAAAVTAAAPTPAPAPTAPAPVAPTAAPQGESRPLSRMRRAIARRMVESK